MLTITLISFLDRILSRLSFVAKIIKIRVHCVEISLLKVSCKITGINVCGRMKDIVYTKEIVNIGELRDRIDAAALQIRQK